ncbi:fumarylacetoacetate hydrolase family protein [Alteribacillus sp. HJP-4]|uniref:fumarylacetoacetate hydrolase family protein n=1 Tax=Alteribacillus sp. HJP-4 TaxID=2775394 RepID=UPI0035CD383F
MRLTQFFRNGAIHVGIAEEHAIFDVTSAARGEEFAPATMLEVIKQGEEGKAEIQRIYETHKNEDTYYVEKESVTAAPSVTDAEKIICIGLNYARHAKESGMDEPKEPIVFNKFANALAAHKQPITLPPGSNKVDYEAELAIVIGKEASEIEVKDARDYMYGFTVSNDVSARDFQFKSPQWLLGKSCDGFCPVGPELVTSDEIDDPGRLEIKAYVNGEVRQQSNTSDMIFSCEEIVSFVSRFMTLKPGDLILTGTPEGVIMGYPTEKQVWLKNQDTVTIEIEKLGILENQFIKK